jgi:mannose-6-phosphate isomerase-like protein (cupin superfamily)
MAKVIETHHGRLLADRPELRLELVADTSWLGASHGMLAPGGPVPPLHVHREHADCFLVLEGGLKLLLADGEQAVTGEAWVQVPAGVVHTFAPVEQVRMLNVHAPSAGYSGFIQRLASATGPDEVYRAREGFDQHDPPAEGGVDSSAAIAVRLGGVDAGAGGGETITDRPGRRVTLLADTTELAVTESIYGPGEQGPDPHVHRDHADAFVVLEGALSFTLRGASLHATAGTLVVIPPLVVHSFANEGVTAARFVNLHAPSCGFGDYLRGSNPAFDQHDPPSDGDTDPASVVVTRLAA